MIKAVDYDIGAVGVAYNDADYMNDGDGSYNSGWTYRNDGVDIEKNVYFPEQRDVELNHSNVLKYSIESHGLNYVRLFEKVCENV